MKIKSFDGICSRIKNLNEIIEKFRAPDFNLIRVSSETPTTLYSLLRNDRALRIDADNQPSDDVISAVLNHILPDLAMQESKKQQTNPELKNEVIERRAKEIISEKASKAAKQTKRSKALKKIKEEVLRIFDDNSKIYTSPQNAGQIISQKLTDSDFYKTNKISPLAEERGERTIADWLRKDRAEYFSPVSN